jgi:hypothetical protein
MNSIIFKNQDVIVRIKKGLSQTLLNQASFKQQRTNLLVPMLRQIVF